jgi:hypothetical protein
VSHGEGFVIGDIVPHMLARIEIRGIPCVKLAIDIGNAGNGDSRCNEERNGTIRERNPIATSAIVTPARSTRYGESQKQK